MSTSASMSLFGIFEFLDFPSPNTENIDCVDHCTLCATTPKATMLEVELGRMS